MGDDSVKCGSGFVFSEPLSDVLLAKGGSWPEKQCVDGFFHLLSDSRPPFFLFLFLLFDF